MFTLSVLKYLEIYQVKVYNEVIWLKKDDYF